MPISLTLTPFDHFQIRLTFAVTPNLIHEPCRMHFASNHVIDELFHHQPGVVRLLSEISQRGYQVVSQSIEVIIIITF